MKLTTLLLFSILSTLTSCNGQSSYQQRNADKYAKGDTVKELGSSIMVIYQDKNGELWLGTHENGAYKYNGKTFEKFKLY